jgi:hypothetical protein
MFAISRHGFFSPIVASACVAIKGGYKVVVYGIQTTLNVHFSWVVF